MKISAKKFLLYSSVFAIFTEAFFFNFIIDWKLLYLIIIVNFGLLIRMKKLKFNIWFILLLLAITIHGAICYTVIGIPYNYMFSQIVGLSIVGTYYYNALPLFKTQDIIDIYGKMCVWVALAGYVLLYFNYHDPMYRLQSIFKEPAHYAIVVIPACYYFMKRKEWVKFIIIFGTLLLSMSSLGYIGCGLMLLIPNLTMRRIGYFVAILPLIGIVFYHAYKELPFFAMRVDDTYEALNVVNTGKFPEETNLSSYALISNMYIANRNFQNHPLGSGIGSHHYMFTERYLAVMRPPESMRIQRKHTTNSLDANSMFTRMFSDFGILGVIFIIYILYRTSDCFKGKHYMAQAIFVYFLLKLIRDGHYFPPEFFFFIWLFYYLYKQEIQTSTVTAKVLYQ